MGNSTTVGEPRQWQWQVQTPQMQQQQQQQRQQRQQTATHNRIMCTCVYHYSLSCCEHKSVVRRLCVRGGVIGGIQEVCSSGTQVYHYMYVECRESRLENAHK